MVAKKKQIYLAGAIQKAPDQGKRWRTILEPQLKDLGFSVFNPCVQTDGPILERFGWKKFAWDEIKKPENQELYFQVMREIVDKDLTALLGSDIVIVYMDQYGIASAGTHGEMTTVAWHNIKNPRAQIPIYVVLSEDTDLNDISGWLIGCVDHVFYSFRELRAFLASHKDK